MGMVTELGDGVWQIDLNGVNAYLAADDVLTLVDTGLPWHADAIRRAVNDAGYALDDIERVLLTHYDFDHVGGLTRLDLDATVYIGTADAGFLTGAEKPPIGTPHGLLQRVTYPVLDRPDGVVEVEDGDHIGSFTAYHTPGHTPGHVAYVSDALNVAFIGDLVRERKGHLSPSPRLYSYDRDAVLESIHELADREPAIEILAMGHGVPFIREGAIRLAELGEEVEQ
jgi:glyoxylase-like metal-dependent hydrolase (beta-lactamase superfamily II)